MKSALKLVIGLIVVIVGLGLFVDSVFDFIPGISIRWWNNFLLVASGVIPLLLIIGGAFVLWLVMDEIKTNKEFKKYSSAPKPQPQPVKPAATPQTNLIQPKIEEKKH